MLTKDFYFDLPPELIAQTPADRRGDDRLLVLDRTTGAYQDAMMADFPSFLTPGSLLVVNNSKVRKARVYAESETGGTVEFLFLEENLDHSWQVMVTKTKRQHLGKRYTFQSPDGTISYEGTIIKENPDDTRTVSFSQPLDESFFEKLGHVPLPPYIKRDDDFNDESRYQTVYAKEEGSVAAPTAGLHFTEAILNAVKARGCDIVEVTLHVGPGTFLPVRTENLEDHHMHFERYEITPEVADAINTAKRSGRLVVATGTTSVRTLESAYDPQTGLVRSGWARTNLFIKPGFTYHVVDQLLTNFHTPESTLLALVSAFAGKDHIFAAYQHAIEEKYHFFSYGDAMFIK
ncbi:MAG: tRNA preQ1(34) S-adenosylmethionine ribosyltransferase-isomerase QueA [Sphaerochaeta sp.]|jgi:S-adenosylmethionine:tRNA ribosyltransferase-isomerase|nr:tRNA preQ1(34) S-adenosylmethionine ribosyltransferase-isomerase QueA [Sphaerochaeta sp.]MCH3920722.1 tRNA preQ1(34) S-adenosylmethionine ribosyltransferase-isomerase QueA [Sphaerochaeta sp.]MCI2045597.1 tRNA preQ1(34) S-adenosylmethionine ribosyltransferase-isomerase QueA [Sphaerochaeta sp.]MCI2077040.1 tRNA preQ1(34) S-adenosylmethionine ribosyltransferase-isomerase QueA [Sphaerochaeta sp.]MCI2096487.1 tRNA preQ1(34) S-adenosylmethionine ribosyltransferase-isomerase QueA [Sphaerochaeta sp.